MTEYHRKGCLTLELLLTWSYQLRRLNVQETFSCQLIRLKFFVVRKLNKKASQTTIGLFVRFEFCCIVVVILFYLEQITLNGILSLRKSSKCFCKCRGPSICPSLVKTFLCLQRSSLVASHGWRHNSATLGPTYFRTCADTDSVDNLISVETPIVLSAH